MVEDDESAEPLERVREHHLALVYGVDRFGGRGRGRELGAGAARRGAEVGLLLGAERYRDLAGHRRLELAAKRSQRQSQHDRGWRGAVGQLSVRPV